MNKWFADTFLTSLFERTAPNKAMWLTAKQTAICADNMSKSTSSYQGDSTGTMYHHITYRCNWRGREVTLEYSKRNSCGAITFGFSADEIATATAAADAERDRIQRDRINRVRNNPERRAARMEQLEREIDNLRLCWQDAIADGVCGDEDNAYYATEIETKTRELIALK